MNVVLGVATTLVLIWSGWAAIELIGRAYRTDEPPDNVRFVGFFLAAIVAALPVGFAAKAILEQIGWLT